MKESSKGQPSPVERLQEFINSTAKKTLAVGSYGKVNDELVNKVIDAIKGGSKLPNTYHFLEGAVVIRPPGKIQRGKQ